MATVEFRAQRGDPVRLHDFFDYWARERPAAESMAVGGRSLSYADAAALANRLASRLVAVGAPQGKQGGGPRQERGLVPAALFRGGEGRRRPTAPQLGALRRAS